MDAKRIIRIKPPLKPKHIWAIRLRRTNAALVYRKTGGLRTWQLLRGHRKLESTLHDLWIEVDEALALSTSDGISYEPGR